jgi:hypothetical protein
MDFVERWMNRMFEGVMVFKATFNNISVTNVYCGSQDV